MLGKETSSFTTAVGGGAFGRGLSIATGGQASSGPVNAGGVVIRHEVFDYYCFPTPSKLTLVQIVNLVGSLYGVATSDLRVTLDQFVSQVIKNVPGLTTKEAEAYFLLCKMLDEEESSFLLNAGQAPIGQLFTGKAGGQRGSPVTCDARALALMMFIQLLTTFSRHSGPIDPKQQSSYNEGIRSLQNSGLFSPINSPRAKATRPSLTSGESSHILAFVRYNLKTMLKLVSRNLDAPDESCFVSVQDFNVLRLILRPDSTRRSTKRLSVAEASGLFTDRTRTSLGAAAEWLSTNVSVAEPDNLLSISGLTRSVCLKDREAASGRDVRISNCEDSHIFIDAAVTAVSVSNCVNCTVYVAATSRVTAVDKCDGVSMTTTTSFLRICNSIDSSVFSYSLFAPIMLGDSKGIVLGPHNANHYELFERLKEARIPLSPAAMVNFASPLILNNASVNHSLVQPKDFLLVALPSNYKALPHKYCLTTDIMLAYLADPRQELEAALRDAPADGAAIRLPLLAPDEFRECILSRYKKFAELQSQLKTLRLQDDQASSAHMVIQAVSYTHLTLPTIYSV
eukprot:TRINITY_DN1418_c0_g1_i1.p1 TRINITY_DN1418_c0_g1~~TRINITY_DN1418_c0_g1_i1.p1  ORF type:complete len:568 (-),score=75.54 TRINITY_DN1418_c0_g1_i1:36-1739(-)